MAKELTDIIKAAAVVRDETAMQQNTATRVGGVLTDLAQFVGEAVFAAGMTAKTSAAGVSVCQRRYTASHREDILHSTEKIYCIPQRRYTASHKEDILHPTEKIYFVRETRHAVLGSRSDGSRR